MIHKVVAKHFWLAGDAVRTRHSDRRRFQGNRQHLDLEQELSFVGRNKTRTTDLARLPVLRCKVTDRRARQRKLLPNAPQPERKDRTQRKVRVHICTRNSDLESCRTWWARRWRDDADGGRARVVTVCDSVRSPEGLSTDETLVAIYGRDKLIEGGEFYYILISYTLSVDGAYHWHHWWYTI